MNDRELLQLAGHLNPVTYPELYDYYNDYPKRMIKRKVDALRAKDYLIFTAYERTGLYITPIGLKHYDS